jgi:hypothetical protein
MSLFSNPLRLPIALIALVIGVATLPAPAQATNGDDWVLVERFQNQLEKANAGEVNAMYEVGRMYERGRGTPQNLDKAAQWFSSAAQQGSDAARARLGLMYYDGRGLPQDLTKAYKNLSTAAKAGIPTAQFYLAKMYEQGDGVNADRNTALKWYRQAAKGGYYQAKYKIKQLSQAPPPKPKPKPKPAPKPRPQPKPVRAKPAKPQVNTGLMQVLQDGNWVRENRAADYLPSVETRCKVEGDETLECSSEPQTRNSGFAIITFTTEATLSGFNSADQFEVSYVHNVLRAKAVENDAPAALGDEDEETVKPKVNVKLGKQSKEHHLNCELENENTVVCSKGGLRTLTFKRFNE